MSLILIYIEDLHRCCWDYDRSYSLDLTTPCYWRSWCVGIIRWHPWCSWHHQWLRSGFNDGSILGPPSLLTDTAGVHVHVILPWVVPLRQRRISKKRFSLFQCHALFGRFQIHESLCCVEFELINRTASIRAGVNINGRGSRNQWPMAMMCPHGGFEYGEGILFFRLFRITGIPLF